MYEIGPDDRTVDFGDYKFPGVPFVVPKLGKVFYVQKSLSMFRWLHIVFGRPERVRERDFLGVRLYRLRCRLKNTSL